MLEYRQLKVKNMNMETVEEEIGDISAAEHTAMELELVLERTRMENGGITLDLAARTIRKVYDRFEVDALIERLEAYSDR